MQVLYFGTKFGSSQAVETEPGYMKKIVIWQTVSSNHSAGSDEKIKKFHTTK